MNNVINCFTTKQTKNDTALLIVDWLHKIFLIYCSFKLIKFKGIYFSRQNPDPGGENLKKKTEKSEEKGIKLLFYYKILH